MKILIFGASGMIGRGVLQACLADADVEQVTVVVRRASAAPQDRLREVVQADFSDFSAIEAQAFAGVDAVFFCLGVASAGMDEADYTRVTFGFTLAAAQALARVAPGATFIYVSGAGADSTEQGSVMWARVRGRTENALLRLPLKAFVFRLALVQPLDGIVSRTRGYRWFYALARPLLPVLARLLPRYVTTTRQVGGAMLHVARHGAQRQVLESADINAM